MRDNCDFDRNIVMPLLDEEEDVEDEEDEEEVKYPN